MEHFHAVVLTQATTTGKWTGECELRDAWGSPFRAYASVFSRIDPGPRAAEYLCLAAAHRELSAQNAQSYLADRELLHALMHSVPDSIYFKDRESRFLRVSRAMIHKFGLSDQREIIGKTDFDFFSSEHATIAFNDEQKILKTGIPLIEVEEQETWHDGRANWVSTTKMPLYDNEGEIVGTFGISRDITAHKNLARERHDLELQLQLNSKLESMGRLAAGVAHEINTPTQYLATNTRFLDDSFAVMARVIHAQRAFRDAVAASPAAQTPEIAAALKTLTEADNDADLPYLLDEIPVTLKQSLEGLDRVARIVRSLKEFSHPSSTTRAPADLNRIVENALTVSRHEWKYVAEVRTELAPDLPPLPCIADQIGQVILNLVINAAHTIGDTLKPRNRERGLIIARTTHTPSHAIVEIHDDGAGIPKEVLAKIFEPFFTTKPVGKGTGQGLALVKTIVETNHQGIIEVSTEVGAGTTFRLSLPFGPPGAAPSAPSQ